MYSTSAMNHAKIILMVADEMSCTARNSHYGQGLTNESDRCLFPLSIVLMDRDEEAVVQYRGDDVTLDFFVGILTSTHPHRCII